MTDDDFAMELKVHILRSFGCQRNAAKEWGVSGSYVSSVCRGLKSPNKTILKSMGLERLVNVTYIQA